MSRLSPGMARLVHAVRHRLSPAVRLPLGLVMSAGGLMWFLPFLGLWMLPVGLLILAIDIAVLRPRVSALSIRMRRAWMRWRRKARDRGRRRAAGRGGAA
jgi:hypothetical protein